MITEHQQDQASMYVLGALSAEERHAFESELRGNTELGRLVKELSRTVELMTTSSASIAPPDDLKTKVLQRINSVETGAVRATPDEKSTPSPGFLFKASADSSGWKELPVRGAWVKLLSIDRARNYAVMLGRLEAGVRYPAHQHEAAEEICILSGDLHIGDLDLGPGDFHHADAGTSHGINYSVNGCTLIAVLHADHELVQFATA